MKADTLAIIQNKEITNVDLDRIIARYPIEKRIYFETSAGRKQLLEQKVAFTLFGLYAKECGKEKEQSFVEQINDLKEQILTQIIMQEIFVGVDVTTDEVERFYQSHPEVFKIEDTIDAKHTLVDTKEEADRTLTFEEVKDKIKAHLISEKQQKIYEKKLEELKATYNFEISEDVESKL